MKYKIVNKTKETESKSKELKNLVSKKDLQKLQDKVNSEMEDFKRVFSVQVKESEKEAGKILLTS